MKQIEVDSSMSPVVAAKKAKPSDQGSEDVSTILLLEAFSEYLIFF